MASKQPSKQKRQAQNRSQRAALAARKENATVPAPSGGGDGSGKRSWWSRRPGRGGTSARQPAVGTAAIDPPDGQPVGYRAALTSVLMAVAGVVACFTIQVPTDASGDPVTTTSLVATWAGEALEVASSNPEATPAEIVDGVESWTPGFGSRSLAVATWPFSVTLALPVVGAGLGFLAVSRRSPSRSVVRSTFITLLGALLTPLGAMVVFLPAGIAMAVAAFQRRKAEMAATRSEAAAGDVDDEVIDVDEVEADDVADEPTASVADEALLDDDR